MTEHAFDINLGGTNYNWLLYDVGGAVRAWFCFFVRRAKCLLIGSSFFFSLFSHSQRGQASLSVFSLSFSRRRVSDVVRLLTVVDGVHFVLDSDTRGCRSSTTVSALPLSPSLLFPARRCQVRRA